MLDLSLKPEAERLNALVMNTINQLRSQCTQLAAELDLANEAVRKQEKTDARENADLQVAREQQAMANHAYISVQKQIMALNACIENYEPKGSVTLGTTMELKLLAIDGSKPKIRQDKFILKVVEHDAGNAADGFIAQDSKVGQACLGRVAGTTITVKAPMGVLQYKIERIY